MTSQSTAEHPGYGLTEKRRAIAQAAHRVFGRDGFTRASVDTIAAEAEVSKRTVYNHYGSKELLFLSVLQDSAAAVAKTQTEIIERYLGAITDLETDLVAFAHAWISPLIDHADHFALIRQINAEATHIPPAALEAWRVAGPQASEQALARQLQRIADRGLLHINDTERAATHLIHLTTGEVTQRSFYGALPLDDSQVNTIVTNGVQAFLQLYRS